jgi:hypothetical protein
LAVIVTANRSLAINLPDGGCLFAYFRYTKLLKRALDQFVTHAALGHMYSLAMQRLIFACASYRHGEVVANVAGQGGRVLKPVL